MTNETMLTTKEVAELTGRSLRTIADWRRGYYWTSEKHYFFMDQSKLICEWDGAKYLYKESDVKAWTDRIEAKKKINRTQRPDSKGRMVFSPAKV